MQKTKLKWLSIVIFLLLNILIWSKVPIDAEEDLKVIFLDVGQGDAILIEAPNGNQVLIDGGPNDQVLRELSKVISPFDRSVDMIIATHPDSDHIGGLISVLDRFETEVYLESGSKSDTLVYKSLENALDESGVIRITAKRGMIFDLGDGVLLKILFPDRDASGLETNTASIITQLIYGDIEFMLTGDSPASIEKYLVSTIGGGLASDVLKAGHHGSKTSSAEIFINTVSPIYAVISAGEGNRYGHPHQEVLDQLINLDIEILSTAEVGSIEFSSNGEKVWLK